MCKGAGDRGRRRRVPWGRIFVVILGFRYIAFRLILSSFFLPNGSLVQLQNDQLAQGPATRADGTF